MVQKSKTELRNWKLTACSKVWFFEVRKKHPLPPSKIMKYGSISVTLMSIYIHRMRMLAQAVMLPVYNRDNPIWISTGTYNTQTDNFCHLPLSFHANTETVFHPRQCLHPSTHSLIHYSPITPPHYTTYFIYLFILFFPYIPFRYISRRWKTSHSIYIIRQLANGITSINEVEKYLSTTVITYLNKH